MQILQTAGGQFVHFVRHTFYEKTPSNNWLTKGYLLFNFIMVYLIVCLASNPSATSFSFATYLLLGSCIFGLFVPFVPGADQYSNHPTKTEKWEQLSLLFGIELLVLYAICAFLGLPDWRGWSVSALLCASVSLFYGMEGNYKHYPWLFCATVSCLVSSFVARVFISAPAIMFPDWELATAVTFYYLFKKYGSTYSMTTAWRRAAEWSLWILVPQILFFCIVKQYHSLGTSLVGVYLWESYFWVTLAKTGIFGWLIAACLFIPLLWGTRNHFWEPTVKLESIPYPIVSVFGGSLLVSTVITRLLSDTHPFVYDVFPMSALYQFVVFWILISWTVSSTEE